MKTYRILFTGVGRRVELVQAFRQAALVLNRQLKIYGADMVVTAPALAFCDYVRIVRGMKEEGYIDEILKICRDDHIDLLIPTIDTDLLILSRNIDKFVSTKVMVSSFDMISICRNKNFTSDFFVSCGLNTPKTINKLENFNGTFPCFIKPKDGSSSINAYKVENQEELEIYCNIIQDYIIQPFVGGTEYTVDIFCDFNGKPIYITPRKRLRVRAGEVLKTEIVLDQQIINECGRIIEKFIPTGPLTVQLIRDKEGTDYFIEINPRFSGGVSLSMKAGARSAESILQILSGEKIKVNLVDDRAIYSRFDQSVCIDEGKKNQPIKGIIFDLDDTLYSEKQYVRSGYKAVSRYLGEKDAYRRLWFYFEQGKPAIDCYLNEIGRIGEKDKCLEVYRHHKPKLSLYEGVAEVMKELRERGIKIGIITDGRPEGQRNKIMALGLDINDVIITDEIGGTQFRKPCDIAFRIMERKWMLPYEEMAYIGDNTEKDFQTLEQLGIRRIWFRNKNGLYRNNNSIKINYIDNIKDILRII